MTKKIHMIELQTLKNYILLMGDLRVIIFDKYSMDNAIINTKNIKASELRKYYQNFIELLLGKYDISDFLENKSC